MFKTAILFSFITSMALGAKPLVINNNSSKITYSIESLLKNKNTRIIKIPKDPSYGNVPSVLTAIPLSKLLKDFKFNPEHIIQFNCSDGFSAPLESLTALNESEDKAIAYLAIEDPRNKWQTLPQNKMSAGPFRVVWLDPEKSNIVEEQWPLMITSISIIDSLQSSYPKIFPSKKLAEDHPARKGFKVYLKNCFACHRINQQGEGDLGPDLNYPMNPTEYFKEHALKKLIRKPMDVRTWKGSLMPEFDREDLSDQEIDQLVEYLKHMSKNKVMI